MGYAYDNRNDANDQNAEQQGVSRDDGRNVDAEQGRTQHGHQGTGEHPDMQHHHQDEKHRQPRPCDGGHDFAPFDEHEHDGEEKKHIARVGHGDAPRVVGDIENGVAFVVVVALVETIALVLQDVVH